MSGTRQRSTFDGMCVKTIVLISPIRFAIRTASSAETPARMFAPKKMPAQDAGIKAEFDMEPVCHHALDDEPARKCVEREERGEPHHHAF